MSSPPLWCQHCLFGRKEAKDFNLSRRRHTESPEPKAPWYHGAPLVPGTPATRPYCWGGEGFALLQAYKEKQVNGNWGALWICISRDSAGMAGTSGIQL